MLANFTLQQMNVKEMIHLYVFRISFGVSCGTEMTPFSFILCLTMNNLLKPSETAQTSTNFSVFQI